MTVKEMTGELRNSLVPLYGKGESDAIIRLIFHFLKGWTLTDLLIHGPDQISPYISGKIEEIKQRLLRHEPIQYITGEARFHGMEMKIKPGVLIPRPETEELVDIILDDYKDREDLKVLDICSGSGCIAIALARNLPFSQVTAVDLSQEAMEVTEENSRILKARIKTIRADIFDWKPEGKFNIIVSNPPYVMDKEILQMERNVIDYEPHEALFVRDEDPLVFYSRISDIAIEALDRGGRLYFEINPLEADSLKEMIVSKGFADVTILLDTSGKKRFLTGALP